MPRLGAHAADRVRWDLYAVMVEFNLRAASMLAGWDMVTGEPASPGAGYPVLEDLQAAATEVVEQIGYGREITDNVRGFVAVRISSLRLGTTGRFFQGGHPLDFARLLDRNVVFEIEDAGDDRDKAFLMGTELLHFGQPERLEQVARQQVGRRYEIRPVSGQVIERCSKLGWPDRR